MDNSELQFVRDGTNLSTPHQRRNEVSQLAQGLDGRTGVPATHQIFALDLGAATRSEVQQEMGEPFVPGPGLAQLRSAVQRIIAASCEASRWQR